MLLQYSRNTGEKTIGLSISDLSALQCCIAFLLVLFGSSFIGLWYVLIYCALLFSLMSIRLEVRPTLSLVVLIVFSVCVILNGGVDSSSRFGHWLVAASYPAAMLTGQAFVKLAKRDNKKMETTNAEIALLVGVLAVSLGFFIHYLLNFIINAGQMGRNGVDIWSGSVMSATIQAALVILPVGLSCAMLILARSSPFKLLSGFVIIVILSYNLILSGRTLPLLLIVSIAVSFAFALRIKRVSISWGLIIAVLFAVFFATIIYESNFLGIQDALLQTAFFQRYESYGLTEDTRLDHKLKYIELLFDYPSGEGRIYSVVHGYAHDIVLDTYDSKGAAACIVLVIYLVMSTRRFFQVIAKSNYSDEVRGILLCVYVACFLEFCIEPIIIGMPWLLAAFCFIDGLVLELLATNKDS